MKINTTVSSAIATGEFSASVGMIEPILSQGGIPLLSAELIHHNINVIVKAEFKSIPVCIKLYYQGGKTSLRRVTPLAEESNALISLAQSGIPVPHLIEINHTPILGSENFSGYIYHYAECTPINSEKTPELHLLADSLAKMHKFDKTRLKLGEFSMLKNSIHDSRKAIDQYFPMEKMLAEPWSRDLLDTWEREISRGLSVLKAIPQSELVLSVVHGRVKPEHVQCVADSNILIIDWETICISERVVELAYVLSRFCLMSDSSLLDETLLQSVTDEYMKRFPLNKTERSIISSIFRWGCYWTLFTRYHEHRLSCAHCSHGDLFTQQTQRLEDLRYDLF